MRPEELLEVEALVTRAATALAETLCASDWSLSYSQTYEWARTELDLCARDVGLMVRGFPEDERGLAVIPEDESQRWGLA